MIAIGLRFLAGRFHATPWGRHVNEGTPEWPPSPWRLLRSLVAVWKTKAPKLDESQVRAVLEQLAVPPSFHLPAATTGHTRHYMRWYKKGPEDQTLVFDAFVCLHREDEVMAVWPDARLDDNHRDVLIILLKNLGFLGRTESWCEARLLREVDVQPNAKPLKGKSPEPKQELVRVLCAHPVAAFGDEHVTQTKTIGRGKNKQTVKESRYDPAWHLCIDTAQLHAEKWSDPPGSEWVTYTRPANCFNPLPQRLSKASLPRHIEVARFAIDAPVLPLVQDTLPLAEAVHRCLLWLYCNKTRGRIQAGHSRVLVGKDETGQPLDGHGHAYYLPTDEDGDGRIDHVTVTATAGFGDAEIRALDLFRRLRWGEGDPLRLLLTGFGAAEDFRTPVFSQASAWISATPFLATRHLKKRGRKRDPQELWHSPADFVKAVAREELTRWLRRRADLASIEPEKVRIELLLDQHDTFRVPVDRGAVRPLETMSVGGHMAFDCGPRALRPIQFKRFRRKAGDDGGRRPSGAFRIVFPEPVRGPLCLGHSSHFGLGLFLPEVGTGQGS